MARINTTPQVIQACLCMLRSIRQVPPRVPPTGTTTSSRYLTCGSPDLHWTRPFGRRHWRSQTRVFFRPTLFRSVSTTVGSPSSSDSPPDTVKETSERSGHVSQPYKKKMARNQCNTPRYCTRMSLSTSINAPSSTTRTTNMYNTHVPPFSSVERLSAT